MTTLEKLKEIRKAYRFLHEIDSLDGCQVRSADLEIHVYNSIQRNAVSLCSGGGWRVEKYVSTNRRSGWLAVRENLSDEEAARFIDAELED